MDVPIAKANLVSPICPFCMSDSRLLLWADAHVVAFSDAYPVSPGHTLIVPRRHVLTWFDATADEQFSMLSATQAVKRLLDEKLQPNGYNVGFNAGVAAGQTVAHAHMHVIPRFVGDVADPRGGVRWVIPAQAPYWSKS